MTEIVPVPENLPMIADAATADRTAWIIEQIADGGHMVNAPGMPWAGQEAIVTATMAQYNLERPAAEQAVELARLDLWHGNSSGAGHVERRLLISRLNVIRRVILQAVREPKKTTTYVFKRKRNAKTREVTMIRIPKREQIKEGFDPNLVRLLIDIEAMIAKLNNLEGGGDSELVAEIFKQLEKDEAGQTKEKVVASISQKVKNMDLGKLTQAGRDVIEQALDQERRKKVVSREKGKHGREAVPEADGLHPGAGQSDEAGGLGVPSPDGAGQ
jgi:hypothetical protein